MLLQLFVQNDALIDAHSRPATFELLEGVQPDTVLIESEYTALMPWVQACRAAQLPFGGFFDDLLLPAAQVGAALQRLDHCFPHADKQSPAGKMLWLLDFAAEQGAGVVAVRQPFMGFPCVEWREQGEEPPTDEDWERNKTCPQVGEVRWAKPVGSHRTPVNERVWLHYEPKVAIPPFGGMYPDDVGEWNLVECEILARHKPTWMREENERFLDANPELRSAQQELEAKGVRFSQYPTDEYKGWIQVLCHRVVPLWEIPENFPATHHAVPPVGHISPKDDQGFVETDCLIYEYAQESPEGAPLEWWITTKTEPPRLLLYSLEFRDEPFEIHNAILPE